MAKFNPSELVRAVDRFQQDHSVFAFGFGVIKKYGDDKAGSLAALITYYGFLAIFPLLLLAVTILGLMAGGSRRILNDVLSSTLAQFPIIGNELEKNIHGLRSGSPFGLTIGLLGLIWGSLGASQAGIYAMSQIWNIPQVDRLGFAPRLLRSLSLLVVLAIFLGTSTTLTGLVTFGGAPPAFTRLGGLVLSVIVNIVLFVAAYRILTPASVPTKALIPGALIGGVAWTALQSLGSILISHELRHASQVYGFFGYVLGLLWWIYLGIQIGLYAAEINVVRSRRLWPRSIVQPPFTEADTQMLDTYLHEAKRRPEQRVSVGFRGKRRATRTGREPPASTAGETGEKDNTAG